MCLGAFALELFLTPLGLPSHSFRLSFAGDPLCTRPWEVVHKGLKVPFLTRLDGEVG